MHRIYFKVNGDEHSVGSEVDSDVSVNDYLRSWLQLRGTKYMCQEGGCGACVVSVTAPDVCTGEPRTFAVNSCLVSITSCQDWEIRTVEGIGSRHHGYHPVQRRLAENNGTQCGYCSPGFVMSMYSLLKSKKRLTKKQIENSFGSNTCRCTGYRPILDAFKSFADEDQDIEDLKVCTKDRRCNRSCSEWCIVNKEDVEPKNVKIVLKDNRVWYRVHEITDVFDILDQKDGDYMLVGGNTGKGVIPVLSLPQTLIDISPIVVLKTHYIDQNLVIGSGTTLTQLMQIFAAVSKEREEFLYLDKLYEHLDLVAHIPVRNIGTIAGNLMTKHRQKTFASDIFLLLEAVGATLTIVDRHSSIEVTPQKFLDVNMLNKIILNISIPPFSRHYKFVSFKIMPRSQNAHASVHAAFLYKFADDGETVVSARLVFGGLSGTFVHARKTEKYVVGRKIFTNEVLQEALKVLDSELVVADIPAELTVAYRRKCALGLFYKGLLNLIPKEQLNLRYLSGAIDLRKTRPLSKGSEVYDTNPLIWPITEPMPKVEALAQCSGEIDYVNDLPSMKREVFCAFVKATIGKGNIVNIDPSPALKIPGVLTFLSAKDIPGINAFVSPRVAVYVVQEEVFCSGSIKYYNQPIGLIVAETEKLANRAASLVKVSYKEDPVKPVLTINEAKTEPARISLYLDSPARSRGGDTQRIIKGSTDIKWQYHFTMETQQCVTKPNEDGLDVYISTQYMDSVQLMISDALGIEECRINLVTPRCGGSYGSRISRPSWLGVASSLVSHLIDRPCRFAMSLRDNTRVIGKRFPARAEFEVEINNVGEIQHLSYDFYDDAGYIISELIIILAGPSIRNCYNRDRWHCRLFNVNTDTAVNTWARSPGSLEAIAMTEHIMERISYELNLDPLEVRQRNLNQGDDALRDIIQTLIRDSEYSKRKEEVQKFNEGSRWKKRGLRVALISWDLPLFVDFNVILSVYHGDGSIMIKHGGIEMGQGVNTKIVQLTAYTLNIPMSKIKVKHADVFSLPNMFTTGASRTTESVLFGVVKCCQLLLERLSITREEVRDRGWEVVVQRAYESGINLQVNYRVTSNDQKRYRVAGAALCEVELDILTGEHDIRRVDIVEDVGTSVNPELDVGQIEGSFVMSIGYWTSEHLIYAPSGELLTDRTSNYYVPLAKDIPLDFRVTLRRNSFNPDGTMGARAVAEPATCLGVSVAFALREAITASRRDSGFTDQQWFNVDGPYTLEANVLNAETRLDELKFN